MLNEKFERGLAREWQQLERHFMSGTRYPEAERIKRLTKAAGDHYRKKHRTFLKNRRVHTFKHRLHEGGSVEVRYHVSTFGVVRLVPPEKFIHTRYHFGLK